MIILDGKKLAKETNEKLKSEIANDSRTPGLAIIMVGNRKDSLKYVEKKREVCRELGIKFRFFHLLENSEQNLIIRNIKELNNNPTINGIIVQLPLPKTFHTEKILNAICPEKDVDGFHMLNAGKLFLNREIDFVPCTPLGCIELIDHYGIDVEGLNVCVIGCSNIVGLPLSILLQQRNATVTMCHKYTKHLSEHTKKSDMIFSCCGVPGIVKNDMVKEGVIIIDIGINFMDGKLVGDVDFEGVKDKCSYITPVPGGVGPMTIAMLMKQTIKSWKRLNN
jgi:methylenetetrahydrofolate dehydrogenase (NADP+)/methenyltetrahydrofolate cyclohydrolase